MRQGGFGANPSVSFLPMAPIFRMVGNLVQGALFTVMVVRAGMLRDTAFEEELQQQVGRSPRFFLNAPVVLDLKDSEGFTTEEAFLDAGEALRRHTLALADHANLHRVAVAVVGQVEYAADCILHLEREAHRSQSAQRARLAHVRGKG